MKPLTLVLLVAIVTGCSTAPVACKGEKRRPINPTGQVSDAGHHPIQSAYNCAA